MPELKLKRVKPISKPYTTTKRFYLGGGLDGIYNLSRERKKEKTKRVTAKERTVAVKPKEKHLPKRRVVENKLPLSAMYNVMSGTSVKKTETIDKPKNVFEPISLRRVTEYRNIWKKQMDINKINICIIHFNTPQLTECLIRSINKFTPKCNIFLFDNSDKNPFTYRQDNLIYIDNTEGQIIDFKKWLEQYPTANEVSKRLNGCGSAKHCYTVDTFMTMLDENFILLDSDILLKKDITPLYELGKDNIFVGDVEGQWKFFKPRVAPYICFINTKKCKQQGVHFFNDKKMVGLNRRTRDYIGYDTGAHFYEAASEYQYKEIEYRDYVVHFRGGSWEKSFNVVEGVKRNSSFEWLKLHKVLWDNTKKDERIIITMTTWKDRICNVPHVLSDILNGEVLPDLININLSIAEFPNKENDLPKEFLTFLKEYPIVYINWVEGPNRKQWKKIIPSLAKYPNDAIVCIDDDRRYPPEFLKELVEGHKKNPNNPITVNAGHQVRGMIQHCGHGTLDKLEFFGDILDILDEEIYSQPSSDSFFTYMANRAGHPIIPVNKTLNPKIKMYNEVSPLRKSAGTYGMEAQFAMMDLLDKKLK